MNPPLVKQLKDAGFPIRRYPEWALEKDGLVPAVEWEKNYVPTLSELIEACGEDFSHLYKGNKSDWFVEGLFVDERYDGQTPEEAVANLWLALNK